MLQLLVFIKWLLLFGLLLEESFGNIEDEASKNRLWQKWDWVLFESLKTLSKKSFWKLFSWPTLWVSKDVSFQTEYLTNFSLALFFCCQTKRHKHNAEFQKNMKVFLCGCLGKRGKKLHHSMWFLRDGEFWMKN